MRWLMRTRLFANSSLWRATRTLRHWLGPRALAIPSLARTCDRRNQKSQRRFPEINRQRSSSRPWRRSTRGGKEQRSRVSQNLGYRIATTTWSETLDSGALKEILMKSHRWLMGSVMLLVG